MPAEHDEDAEVEQRAAPAQQPPLVELATSGWSSRTCRSGSARCGRRRRPPGDVGDDHPQEDVAVLIGAPPAVRLRHVLGRANGARTGPGRPPRSAGPAAASRSTASRSRGAGGGSVARHRVAARRRTASPRPRSASRSSSRPARCSRSSRSPRRRRRRRRTPAPRRGGRAARPSDELQPGAAVGCLNCSSAIPRLRVSP